MTNDRDDLVLALESGPEEAIASAKKIAQIGHHAATPKLLELLRVTPNGDLRNALALALSDLGEPRAFAEIVALLRQDRTLGNRGTLLYALRPFDCSSIVSLLVDMVIEGNYEVAREAMTLLSSVDTDMGDDEWQGYVDRLRVALASPTEERKPLLLDLLEMLGADPVG